MSHRAAEQEPERQARFKQVVEAKVLNLRHRAGISYFHTAINLKRMDALQMLYPLELHIACNAYR